MSATEHFAWTLWKWRQITNFPNALTMLEVDAIALILPCLFWVYVSWLWNLIMLPWKECILDTNRVLEMYVNNSYFIYYVLIQILINWNSVKYDWFDQHFVIHFQKQHDMPFTVFFSWISRGTLFPVKNRWIKNLD